jgi:hypothetical protein
MLQNRNGKSSTNPGQRFVGFVGCLSALSARSAATPEAQADISR